MKNLVLIPTLFMAACATTGATGGKSSTAPFPGPAATEKRRLEITDAAKNVMDCMKPKKGEEQDKGGTFAVVADAGGKLTITPVKWNGSDATKQCIVEAGQKAPVSAMPGPSVGTMWEFLPPGEKSQPQTPPEELKVKMQGLAATMQAEVTDCGTRYLGVDFGAQIDIAYFLYNDGRAYAPTVIQSDAKDGGFESCVQEVVAKEKFPVVSVEKPFGATMHFKIGVYGDTQRRKD